jgi:SRSO17 transposase
MTFPLIFEVSKPRERLQPGYKYLTQPEIAGGIRIRELRLRGFRFNLILADSLYGESG